MEATYQIVAYASPEYEAACALREDILRKPLDMVLRPVDIDQDQFHDHVVALLDGKVVGTIIIRSETPFIGALRQMAIADSCQGKGIGQKLLSFAEEHARKKGFQLLTLHARQSAQNFYSKLGYITQGEVFTEIGIPHIIMQKQLGSEEV